MRGPVSSPSSLKRSGEVRTEMEEQRGVKAFFMVSGLGRSLPPPLQALVWA